MCHGIGCGPSREAPKNLRSERGNELELTEAVQLFLIGQRANRKALCQEWPGGVDPFDLVKSQQHDTHGESLALEMPERQRPWWA